MVFHRFNNTTNLFYLFRTIKGSCGYSSTGISYFIFTFSEKHLALNDQGTQLLLGISNWLRRLQLTLQLHTCNCPERYYKHFYKQKRRRKKKLCTLVKCNVLCETDNSISFFNVDRCTHCYSFERYRRNSGSDNTDVTLFYKLYYTC